ncbi:NAD(P) transhydrogenase subunit alpha [Trinickia symbiotica]|uniref:NAD(P) transhydrogenase subunit alpha part 1 n=1 Tax=Trinickia symbiotica TaxID=863227 RepID=A0A2N7WV74_9BURK|nr:Re/Si-specific NAD(P)(+) transhydrogenase subunit alpha [Trinickia symbiotica]PMS33261.1 NAD(P)(+) transhydrogenase (Re/Si-specific) subunit alpha [Trinickia symbiotica]PPK42281.1 NAD(P) transhydrogenase subunit alpha [Trinickia symbiotica]
MKIGIPAEIRPGETRVAGTPETVKRLAAQGHTVLIERSAGERAHFSDTAYAEAGATLVGTTEAWDADLVLKVQSPTDGEFAHLKRGRLLVGMLNPFDADQAARIGATGVRAFALESIPRTTRAQSMDVLSSQANIAGYKAVLLAATLYQRFFPMLMTAAGTIKAARVLVLGAGVAGLQAIATARRLGAVIEASDVRPTVKEQIESLGAKFLDVPYETDEEREAAHGVGGYARPMPASWLARQSALVHERARQADIVITTALIQGRTAPTLLDEDTVRAMKRGSVIVDLAAGHGAVANDRCGGNCTLTGTDEVVVRHGVHIAGYTNLPAMVATEASSLYARNVLDFLKLIIDADGQPKIDTGDDIVAATLLGHDASTLKIA